MSNVQTADGFFSIRMEEDVSALVAGAILLAQRRPQKVFAA
jgi:hypothetical protein